MKPEEFVELQEEAERDRLRRVMSGPLVRSSYRAGRLYQQAIQARQRGTFARLTHRFTQSIHGQLTRTVIPR